MEGTWLKLKSHLGKKNWKDAHISNFQRSNKTLIHMCGAKITAQGSCVRKLFKVFQLYTSQMYSFYLLCGTLLENAANTTL